MEVDKHITDEEVVMLQLIIAKYENLVEVAYYHELSSYNISMASNLIHAVKPGPMQPRRVSFGHMSVAYLILNI